MLKKEMLKLEWYCCRKMPLRSTLAVNYGRWQRQSTVGSRDHDRDRDRNRDHQGWRGSFRSPQGPPTSGSARVDSADRAVNVELRDAVQRAKRDAGQLPGAVRSAEELMASKRLNGFGATFAINAFKVKGDLDGCLRVLSYLDRAGITATAYHYNPAIAATAR